MLSPDVTIALIALAAAILASAIGSILAGRYTLRSVRETLEAQEQQWAEERTIRLEQNRAEEARRAAEAEEATNRWYAEFFITRQIEALASLQQALQQLVESTQFPEFSEETSLQNKYALHDAIDAAYRNLLNVLVIANTYLSPGNRQLLEQVLTTTKQLKQVLDSLRQPSQQTTHEHSPSEANQIREIMISKLAHTQHQMAQTINLARVAINEQLNPKALRRFAEHSQ